MSPEVTATIRTAYNQAIPALEAIVMALEAAPKDDDDAQERKRAILMELAYARACGSALKRAAVLQRVAR